MRTTASYGNFNQEMLDVQGLVNLVRVVTGKDSDLEVANWRNSQRTAMLVDNIPMTASFQ